MQFKQKSLCAALLGAVTVAGGAQAASLSADGVGSVLSYPYYTVNGGNDTAFSIVNSTTSSKIVKVRFREAKNTQDVLDFNLLLSPQDVWTAAVYLKNGVPLMKTVDTSCTVPAGVGSGDGTAFRDFDLNETGETAATKAVRLLEGHIEVIELATVPAGTLSDNITHVAQTSGPAKPKNCGAAISALYTTSGGGLTASNAGLLTPTGGLFGNGRITNVQQGIDFGYAATALNGLICGAPFNTLPSDQEPTFIGGASPTAYCTNAFVVDGTNAYSINFTGANAVAWASSAPLMRSNVYAEWATEAFSKAATDLVVTFPTKKAFVNGSCTAPQTAIPPFPKNFCSNKAPVTFGVVTYDREEQGIAASLLDVSPLPPAGSAASLDYEVNVVTIRGANGTAGSKILGSNFGFDLKASAPAGNEAGWLNMDLVNGDATQRSISGTGTAFINGVAQACASIRLTGLPVEAQVFQSAKFDNLNGVLSNYGANFEARYKRQISCL